MTSCLPHWIIVVSVVFKLGLSFLTVTCIMQYRVSALTSGVHDLVLPFINKEYVKFLYWTPFNKFCTKCLSVCCNSWHCFALKKRKCSLFHWFQQLLFWYFLSFDFHIGLLFGSICSWSFRWWCSEMTWFTYIRTQSYSRGCPAVSTKSAPVQSTWGSHDVMWPGANEDWATD